MTEEVFSLNRTFHQAETLILGGNIDGDDKILQLIDDLDKCQKNIDSEGIFSKNEEIDDFSTFSLKYLAIEYFVGKAHSLVMNLLTRRDHLVAARNYYTAFIQKCVNLKIVNEEEELLGKKPHSPDEMRTLKIAKFKRQKETQKRIETMSRMLGYSNMGSTFQISASALEAQGDREEEVRELYLLQLQAFAREAVEELALILQESELLDHMADLRELEDLNSAGAVTEGGSHSISAGDGRINQSKSMPGLPTYSGGGAEISSSGIIVTKTSKVNGQLVMSRETVRGQVFEPRMEGWSMTVEEFGELELQRAREREAATTQSQESAPPKKYAQLEADGEEDIAELVDKATLADRAWDDWKDSVQRGSGNKAGKRF